MDWKTPAEQWLIKHTCKHGKIDHQPNYKFLDRESTAQAYWINITTYSSNTKHLYNIYTMLDQRLRRWADVV